MTTYAVINRATGAEVYRYQHTEAVPWQGMEFATHDHVALPDDPPPDAPPVPAFVWTRLEYLRRFTGTERVTIRAAAAASPVLADYLHLLDLAEEVRSDDPDTIAAVQMLEGAGLIAPGRAAEILGGA
jgi:hypothetical protein